MNNVFSFRALAGRLRVLAGLAVLFVLVNLALRLVLQMAFSRDLPWSVSMLGGLSAGLLNDLATLAFVLLLPATLLLAPTDRFLHRPAGRVYYSGIIFACAFIFVFTAFAEYFFWGEFKARFNFIAVDYLIYTGEVLRNIGESYPMGLILPAITALSAMAAYALQKLVRTARAPAKTSGLARLAALGGLCATAGLVFVFFTPLAGKQNRFWDEYAKNGVYELFSAFRHNQLDYRAFYKTMDTQTAFNLMRREISEDESSFAQAGGDSLERTVTSRFSKRDPNVIVVIMESMGSKWLGKYTPNLNRLAAAGLSFSNMLSTGTRTVRGIEAVMLSVPPTPGNSIVRRPDNAGLFNLGTEFRRKGYALNFIYGGIGYFDNMNAFFAGNGFQVVDKLDFAARNKTFATAWGQCDEDLFAESLDRADASQAAGKPFMQILLTTSNHRPFTYPKGKVSIDPGSSRTGAVNYSDYAIGSFMRAAEKKPWFNNTVFVFVGDHPSAVAGKTEVPADGYGIACIMYGPKFFQPEKVDTLCSQIDVGPTLLAALGWQYRSQFFGADARELPAEAGRAWISTYQLLGFRTENQLAVLAPNNKIEITSLSPNGRVENRQVPLRQVENMAEKTVASYQCAYDLFTGKQLRESAMLLHAAPDAKSKYASAQSNPPGPSATRPKPGATG